MKKGTQISILLALIVIIIAIYLIIIFLAGSKKSPAQNAQSLADACYSLFDQDKYEESLKNCQELIDKYPNFPNVHNAIFMVGCSQQRLEKHQEALLTFQNLIENHPQSTYIPDAIYYSAASYLAIKNYDKARQYSKWILESYPDTHQWIIDGAKKIQTVDIPASQLLHQTLSLFKEEKYEEAIEKGQEILEKYPTSTSIEDVYLTTGVSYQKLNNHNQALSILQELISNYPDSRYIPDALYYSAASYGVKENYDKAREYCQRILENYPDTRQSVIDRTNQLLDKITPKK